MENSRRVEEYITKKGKWKGALTKLREIILSTPLEETIKWGMPVYTLNGKNVVGIGAFKSFVGIWFFQGALLKDEKNKLINAQEGITKALRQWRFTSEEEIERDREIIRQYVEEAINNQKLGKEIKPERQKPLVIPPELQERLAGLPELKAAFDSLSLSKQREFAEYISEAKRSETKQKRLEKITPLILNGIGLHDKYRK